MNDHQAKAVLNETVATPVVTAKKSKAQRNGQLLALAVCLSMALVPEFATAATGGGNPIGNFLTGILAWVNNGVVRSVGIIAVLSMGVAAYIGRISWELAMKVGAGVILTFGAAALVDQFSAYVS